MPVIASGNLDHASLLLFEKNFERIATQKDTKLLNTPAIKHVDIKGISNISRMDGNKLIEVTSEGRNPSKKYLDIRNDNRKSVTRRFTGSYLLDSYDKAVKLITDPTSDLFENLKDEKNRMTDACIADAAIASVTVGGPEEAGTTLSAEDDGVITIDGKTNFSYNTVISPAITAFTNNYINCSNGTTLAISALEEQHLRDDEKYMNALYSSNNTVDKGTITNASGFHVATFAGTQNGVNEIESPILPEKDGIRSNLLLAPGAIAFAIEIGRLDCERAPGKVNSWEINIDLWVKAVRLQGKKVIRILSTI